MALGGQLNSIRNRIEQNARRLWLQAHDSVDGASLAVVRIAFGAVMLGEAFVYLSEGYLDHYFEASFFFSYWGFEWVPNPGKGAYALMATIGAAAGAIMVGYRYRLATVVLFLGFSWFFLLEATEYLNHFYFVILLSFVMIFVPANRMWSMDSVRRPEIASESTPAWALWLVRFQIAVVYVGGGVAKLNSDWLRGQPMTRWLGWEDDFPLVGHLFEKESVGHAAAITGVFLDLYIVPLLLWRKSRPLAYVAIVWFHLMNHTMFNIGIFPWMMILGTTIFFEPDWPRRALRRIGAKLPAPEAMSFKPDMSRQGKAIVAVLMLFVGAQVALPFRHFAYEGDPNWTEEGHQWSWHMKLRHKSADVTFIVVEPGEEPYEWDTDELTSRQERRMSVRPDLILHYAHHIRDEVGPGTEVYVNATAEMNFRPEQTFIDPTVDLAKQARSLAPKTWIWPLEYELNGDPIERD